MFRKSLLLCLPLILLVLCACTASPVPDPVTEPVVSTLPAPETTEATAPTFPDGDSNDVTCKGSYTGSVDSDTVVASVGESRLTLGQLQAAYWAQVSQYRLEDHPDGPDFGQPLDRQACTADDSAATWQQYFLRQALRSWHQARALIQRSLTEEVPIIDRYKPIQKTLDDFISGLPVTSRLYGYNKHYQINTLHQDYLDSLPQRLEALSAQQGFSDTADMTRSLLAADPEDVLAFAEDYNRGYMYLTFLNDCLELPQEDVEALLSSGEVPRQAGYSVDLRHILIPAEGQTDDPKARAEALIGDFRAQKLRREADFAELANKCSGDLATAPDGGAYYGLITGQLPGELDAWCFNELRTPGDIGIFSLPDGAHILYFCRRNDLKQQEAERLLRIRRMQALVEEACAAFPMAVHYEAITLENAAGGCSLSDLLYPDVAHQRYPEIPLFLQQDYQGTYFGGNPVSTHGCGIADMAMIATYLTDSFHSVPEMCALFGKYSFSDGTDGQLYEQEPQALGFYLAGVTEEAEDALRALEAGHVLISAQGKGYWTNGGHYIVLEKIDEKGVQVRDPNLYNYKRIARNNTLDRHPWNTISSAGFRYWIFDKKVTRSPLCVRCQGDDEAIGALPLTGDYLCPRCQAALIRRNVYLDHL